MDYKNISKDLSKKILMYLEEPSGWRVAKCTKHISVLAKPATDFPGTVYRAEALIEVPAAKLFPFIYCAEYRSKWDRALQSYKLVDTIDEDTFIYRSITHSYGMGLVSPRDFVFLLHIKKYGDLMTTNSLSVDHPDYPPCQNYVRGTSFPSGYACCPLPGNPNHSKLMAIIQVDLGGKLMPSVIDSVMPMSLMNLVTDCKTGLKALKENIP
ncbi:stAR-related lipid transfer protein 6 isoform X2 [Rhineura floridana]|uniref:stAR-related lipid transfer protein 6 isoform X2 n=1 Tax=Rhineura floridana TaxID=261503 RepID=UPI002AC879B2|nr:stAR-related lipid transfer protein 6 isoform X2 [Rhineura floridana]